MSPAKTYTHNFLNLYFQIYYNCNRNLNIFNLNDYSCFVSNDFMRFNLPNNKILAMSNYGSVKTISSIFSEKIFYNHYFRFFWHRVVLFAGLGYKRKVYAKHRIMFSYIADRHWILYKFSQFSFVYPARRRNFIFLSQKKNDFVDDYTFFSSLRKPYVYKMKGFLDYRVKRRFIFIRRLRLRRIKTKLSKKQMLL